MEIKQSIVLRKATMEDAKLLYQWKNDKATIENSITKRGVTMEEHLKWLENVIDNPNRKLFILDLDGTSVGQLRLDFEKVIYNEKCSLVKIEDAADEEKKYELSAEISYGLGAEYRGKGLGKVLLEQADTLATIFKIAVLKAEVLPHNKASQKLFKKLGYIEEQRDDLYIYTKRYV